MASLDKEEKKLEARIVKIYGKAAREIKKKTAEFTAKHKAKAKLMKAKLKAGDITQDEYQKWLAGQVFIGQQWQDKAKSIASTLLHANQQANAMVEGTRRAIFGEAATREQYQLEHDCKMSLSWNIYDSATVTRLIKKQPELLPRRVVNGKKDKAWNKANIAGAVTQGIIQGEDIDAISRRIAEATASTNMNAMRRYARTAMTGAQNAGRIEAMREARDMGINVKKKWRAALDSRTRDAHADLDGQIAEIDEPFHSILGDIFFPGDPEAAPANVYNCRCALENYYPEYDFRGKRRDNESGDVIWDMPFSQWRAAKMDGTLSKLNDAYGDWIYWQNEVVRTRADRVFSGIWKDDVTAEDFYAKEPTIQAKLQYYDLAIARADARGDAAEVKRLKKLRDQLIEFRDNGSIWEFALTMRKDTRANLDAIISSYKPAMPVKSAFGADAYTQARKDAALWAQRPRDADAVLRGASGIAWRGATQAQREAIYEYTRSFHKFNEPLRGIEYGSSRFLGVGNTDLNAGSANNGKRLNAMTEIIDTCQYNEDVWLQRGVSYGGMDKFFNCDPALLQNGSQQELENALLGNTVTEYGFMSCGSSKGQGFSGNPIILNIYAPSGTKMMYVEPFSAFGNGDGLSWDGLNPQRTFGSELETILQQNTQFRIAKIERQSRFNTIYIDLEVIAQNAPQLWTK